MRNSKNLQYSWTLKASEHWPWRETTDKCLKNLKILCVTSSLIKAALSELTRKSTAALFGRTLLTICRLYGCNKKRIWQIKVYLKLNNLVEHILNFKFRFSHRRFYESTFYFFWFSKIYPNHLANKKNIQKFKVISFTQWKFIWNLALKCKKLNLFKESKLKGKILPYFISKVLITHREMSSNYICNTICHFSEIGTIITTATWIQTKGKREIKFKTDLTFLPNLKQNPLSFVDSYTLYDFEKL